MRGERPGLKDLQDGSAAGRYVRLMGGLLALAVVFGVASSAGAVHTGSHGGTVRKLAIGRSRHGDARGRRRGPRRLTVTGRGRGNSALRTFGGARRRGGARGASRDRSASREARGKLHAGLAATPSAESSTAVAWGSNFGGELGYPRSTHEPLLSPLWRSVPLGGLVMSKLVGGGESDSGAFMAITASGELWDWGEEQMLLGRGKLGESAEEAPGKVELSDVADAAIGSNFSVMSISSGSVYASGWDNYGQIGYKEEGLERGVFSPTLVKGVSNVQQVAAGFGTGYALESNGTVWAWGNDQYGQMGNGTSKETEYFYKPEQVKKLTGVVAIASGFATAYALTSEGKVWAWGNGTKGELGNGGTTSSDEPVEVAKLTEVASLSANAEDSSMFAVRENGTVWGWGANEHDNLGTGNTKSVGEPIEIQKLKEVSEVADSNFDVEVLKSNGTVWSWGRNKRGQLGNGTETAESVTPVPVFGVAGAAAVTEAVETGGALADVEHPASLSYPEEVGGYNPSGPCGCGQDNSADPVDTASGEFSEHYTDLSIPGRGIPLDFERTYGSGADQVKGLLGFGWAFSYGMSLSVSEIGLTATVTQENGSQVSFHKNEAEEFAPSLARFQAKLTHNKDGTWTFTRRARTTFTFSSTGQLTSEKDLNGYTTTISYPSSSEIVATDPAGRTLTMLISEGHITSVTDSAGRKVSYTYDTAGDLTEVVDVNGGHTQYTYDSSHELLTVRQPKYYEASGEPTPVLTNEYEFGEVVAQTDQIGRKTEFTYFSKTGETWIKDPAGHEQRDYYEDGILVKSIHGYGSEDPATTTYYYDPVTGVLTGSCDQNGHCITRTDESYGNILTETDPLGHTTEYTYDALNDVKTIKDPLGVTTTMTYDSSGNLLTRSRPLLNAKGETTATQKTEYKHGGTEPVYAGDVTAIVNPNGETWKYRYDAYGDMTSKTAPPTPENSSGDETTYGYDTATGWRTSMVTPRGNQTGETTKYTTAYGYDPFGHLVKVHDPLWSASQPLLHQETFHYDADNNLEYAINGNGEKTTYNYDAANELTEVTMPGANKIKQEYWPNGLLEDREDGNGNTTTYEYNALGYLTSETDPKGRTTKYVRDPVGNILERSTPAGWVETHYDAANEPIEVRAKGNSANTTITYDADGHRTVMTDPTGTSTWKWDSLGRLTSTKDGYGNEVGYAYDLDNNLTTLTYPGKGLQVKEKYDAADRMESLGDWKGNRTTFAYDANSNLTTETLPSGTKVTDTFGYDPTNQIKAITVKKESTTLAAFTYTRNGMDDLSTATTSGLTEPNQSFNYTAGGQLETSGPSSEPTTYAYDPDGNITTRGKNTMLAYDTANEPCWLAPEEVKSPKCESAPTNATTYTYDEAGERTKATPHTGSESTYEYNGGGQLTNYDKGAATYLYEGGGLRLYKKVGSTVEHFVWAHTGPLPLMLADASNDYIYGPGGLPLEQITGSTVVFLHHDELGNTRLLTSTTGSNVGSYNYDPYGTAIHTGTTTTPIQFAGQYTDSETKLIYMRARYYDPTSGQFISRDPLSAVTGEPYSYAEDDPIDLVDPTGLCGIKSVSDFLDCFNPVSSGNLAYKGATALSEATNGVINLPWLLTRPAVVDLGAVGVCVAPGPDLLCGGALGAAWADSTSSIVAKGIETNFCDPEQLAAEESVTSLLFGFGGLNIYLNGASTDAPGYARAILRGGPAFLEALLNGPPAVHGG
jgi:RHS repeat-associated protein